MKLKSLLLGLTGLALLGNSAFATDNASELRFVGSTAFRAPVTKAIINALGGNGHVSVAYNASSAGNGTASGLYGASAAYFVNSSGQIVKTYWTGSLAGVVDLVTNTFNNTSTSAGFLPDNCITYGATGTIYNDSGETYSATGAATSTSTTYGQAITTATSDTTPANVAMSDSFATSVATSLSLASLSGSVGSYSKISSLVSAISGGPLKQAGSLSTTAVGIVPFEWVLGNTTNTVTGGAVSSAVTNITQSQALSLIENGAIPMMFLTGNSSDSNSFAYLIGRNEDSGTRIGAFAEAQYGFGQAPTQWYLTFTGSTITSGSSSYSTNILTGGSAATVSGGDYWFQNYPLNTEKNIYWSLPGHSGYTSGGDVANVLSATNSISTNGGTALNSDGPSENTGAAFFLGYLGFSDAYSITGKTVLSYNGVAPSIPAIQTGAYTFWTYEHCYYVTNGGNALSGTANTNGNNNGSGQVGLVDYIGDLIYSTYSDTTKYGQTAVNPAGVAPAGVLIGSSLVTHGISGTEGTFINYTY